MTPRTRFLVWTVVVLAWFATSVAVHVVNGLWGAVVVLGGPVVLVFVRVVPRLGGLLSLTRDGIERSWRRSRYAFADTARAFAWPAWLRLLWYVAVLLCLITLLLMLMSPPGTVVDVLGATAGTFVMVVAAIDVLNLVRVGLRRGSGKVLGVVGASVGTAIVAAVALSVARKTLFAWMGEDPSAFPAALTLFTAVLVPFGWLALLAGVCMVLMLPMVLVSLVQMGNVKRLVHEGHFYTLLVAWRPFLVCAVPIYLFSQVWGWRGQESPTLRHVGTTVVGVLDYWERPVCGGALGRANQLDERQYSIVVSARNFDWRFKTVRCTASEAAVDRD